jgi:selenocysteine lyase/cysteine desulfurase
MLGIHALSASLSLLLETGMERIEALVLERSAYLLNAVDKTEHLDLLSKRHPPLQSGIVVFRHQTISNEVLYQYLQENGVVCAMRGGGIRFSAHFYNTFEEIDRALEWVRSC